MDFPDPWVHDRTGEFFKKAITTKSQFWDMAVYVFSSVWGLIEAKQSKIGDCYVNINWRKYQAKTHNVIHFLKRY